MNPTVKTILINCIIFAIYMLAQFISPRDGWVVFIALHIPLAFILGIIFLLTGKKEWGLGCILSCVVIFMLGIAVCSIPGANMELNIH